VDSVKWVIPLVVAVLGLYGLGCGGSDEATAISKSDFISKGNKICAETVADQTAAYERIGKEVAGKELTPDESRAKEHEFVEAVADTVDTMIDEFEELGVPTGKQETVDKMLSEYGQGAEEARESPQLFLSGKAFSEADQQAKAVGLNKCEGM